MIMNLKIFYLSTLTVLIFLSSASAEGTWTTYTQEDGLVYNYVDVVAVDFNNVKWLLRH